MTNETTSKLSSLRIIQFVAIEGPAYLEQSVGNKIEDQIPSDAYVSATNFYY